MSPLIEVPVPARSLDGIEPDGESEPRGRLWSVVDRLRASLRGRTIWNVSSTSAGGGGAELLRSFTAHARGAGVDVRWMTIEGSREFFLIVKGLHRALHGASERGMALDSRARAIYEDVLADNAVELDALVRPGDVIVLHNTHTAGLIPYAVRAGARAVWRCHHGVERANENTERGWRFLAPYLSSAHACIFTRQALVPPVCDPARSHVIRPTLDPLSPKNQDLSPEKVRAILVHVGIIEGPPGAGGREFVREDGSAGRVDRSADVIRAGRATRWETPMVVQVSRWDRLKDPEGVLAGFAALIRAGGAGNAEFVLAGPNPHTPADDPEAPNVFNEVLDSWRALPYGERQRIHLANLPMTDREENAAIVNALQRHATVVVQKSLCGGFGLAVSEAMWKGRPVLGSAVGGIADQIEHGKSGLLIENRCDLSSFGQALQQILHDSALRSALGREARKRARQHLFGPQPLEQWCDLIERLDADATGVAPSPDRPFRAAVP